MKVLVTGGTGFLGANLVRHLLARGDEVVCTTRRTSPGLCLDGLDVVLDPTPLDDAEALRRLLDDVDGVYHLAGTFDPGPTGEALMRAIHVDATRSLCEASLAAGVQRLVLCSSSITVGWGGLHDLGDETRAVTDLDRYYGRSGPLRAYHDTKAEAEALVASYVPRGLETVTVNPDYILGAWDIKPTSGAMVLAMAKRWLPVYPKGGKCFQDADDCALGHVYAMDRGVPGERYLLGRWNLSYRDFLGTVASVVGRRPPALPLPRRVGELAGRLGAVLQRLDAHKFAGLDRYVLRSMAEERYRSGRKAVATLGVPETPIEQSIEKALRWFRDHDYY